MQMKKILVVVGLCAMNLSACGGETAVPADPPREKAQGLVLPGAKLATVFTLRNAVAVPISPCPGGSADEYKLSFDVCQRPLLYHCTATYCRSLGTNGNPVQNTCVRDAFGKTCDDGPSLDELVKTMPRPFPPRLLDISRFEDRVP